MKKDKFMLALLPVLLVLAIIPVFFDITKDQKSDSIKFKEEYENFNGEKNSAGKSYIELNIDSNNPIKYASYDELLDIIENKTGIIYFGFPKCPWCRNAVPVLLETAKNNNIDAIYYMNILDERDSYIVEDGELVYALDENGKEVKGKEGYFKLLKALDSVLGEYSITVDGKTYDVGEKRIFAPTVVFIKDGEIVGIHVGTVKSQTDPYIKLTDKEHDELYSIYEEYILKMNSSTCEVGTNC